MRNRSGSIGEGPTLGKPGSSGGAGAARGPVPEVASGRLLTPPEPTPHKTLVCRICGNTENNRSFVLKEMMLGLRDTFDYFQCATCDTVQILTFPQGMEKYYPARYYSLASRTGADAGPLHRFAHALEFRAIIRPSYYSTGRWSDLLTALDLKSQSVECVGKAKPGKNVRILDVGCGSGGLLRTLADLGFVHLFGVDPFLRGDVREDRVVLQKKDIVDLDPSALFELIILHHSLEHVRDPISTLRSVRDHLTEDGTAIVAMPIVNTAFREYGVNWYQLDPPRHFHLFSVRGFKMAVGKSGLHLSGLYFNSTAAQFMMSERFARDLPFSVPRLPYLRPGLFTLREARQRSRAHALNESAEGDQAVFYLRREAPDMPAG